MAGERAGRSVAEGPDRVLDAVTVYVEREVLGELLLSDRRDEIAVAIDVDDRSPNGRPFGTPLEPREQDQLVAGGAE